MEGVNIRRQYLANILAPKFLPLTKDVPTPTECLLCNDLNERLDSIKTGQQIIEPYSSCDKNSNLILLATIPTTAAKGKYTPTTSIQSNIKGINPSTTRNMKFKSKYRK